MSQFDNGTYENQLLNQISANNTSAAQAAADANRWNQMFMNQSMDYNHNEAQLNRDFQEYMSGTSHQREVDDLLKAGLNPILSAHGGATTPSGASASTSAQSAAQANTDMSGTSALGSFFNTLVNSSTSLAMNKDNLANQLKVANIALKGTKYSADKGYESTKYASDNSYNASIYGANSAASAANYSAWMANDAAKYSSDNAYKASIYNADTPNTFEGAITKGITKMIRTVTDPDFVKDFGKKNKGLYSPNSSAR